MDYRDRSGVLRAIGVVLFLAGLGFALLAPLEMYCFYLFSQGGRFHYEGFGFGSFMFGNITSQILGYYLIALVLIPLGYGHLRLRRWARTLALVLVGFWLLVGIPLIILFLLVLIASKELSPSAVAMAIALLGLSYFLLPGLLIRFYRSHDTRSTFEAKDPHVSELEPVPVPLLVLGLLFAFYAAVLHIPILFNGIFPVFGTWVFGLSGIALLDISIVVMLTLAWGLVRQRPWAFWGSLAFLTLLALSSILTLWRSTFANILSGMRFPPTEMEFLQRIPVEGVHLIPFVAMPLLAAIGLTFYCKRYFRPTK